MRGAHDEDGLQVLVQAIVQIRLLELVLKVRHGAQSLDHGAGLLLAREVDQQPAERLNRHARHVRQRLARERHALVQGERSAATLVERLRNGNRHPGKQPPGATYHIDVAERDRVKRARHEGVGDLGHESSIW